MDVMRDENEVKLVKLMRRVICCAANDSNLRSERGKLRLNERLLVRPVVRQRGVIVKAPRQRERLNGRMMSNL